MHYPGNSCPYLRKCPYRDDVHINNFSASSAVKCSNADVLKYTHILQHSFN